MKVMVIGASSALAQHLIPKIKAFGEVVTAGRHSCQHRLDMAAASDTWDFPTDIDVVINLAVNFGGRDSIGLQNAHLVNAWGVLKLVQTCQLRGVKHLVHISSIFANLRETSLFYSPYSLTKRQGEELARIATCESSLALTIIRPSQLYGPVGLFRRHQPFFYKILNQVAAGEEIIFQGRNDALRNFIHVDDVAEVISRCVAGKVSGEFSCIALENIRYSQIARTALQVLGGRSVIRFDPSKPDIEDNPFFSDNQLYRRLDYFPRIDLAEGIAGLIDQLRAGEVV
jgi:nucleoside-diphosphate-sugar epimerase